MANYYRLQNNVYLILYEDIGTSASQIKTQYPGSPFKLPISPSSNEVGALTIIDDQQNPSKIEIVHFESYVDNGDNTVTFSGVTRGQEGTNAQSFIAGSIVAQSITKDAINAITTNIENLKSDWEGSAAYDISVSDIDNWNDAFSWGDHSTYGYLTNITNEILENLSNVDVTGISNNDVLRYNSTTGNFEASTYSSSEFDHDQLQNFGVDEHIDWTQDQNGNKYINKNNINIIDGGSF